MRKNQVLIISFALLFVCIQSAVATQTYKIKVNAGQVKVPNIPVGTPIRPSKAAKVETVQITDEDSDETQVVSTQNKKNIKNNTSTVSKSKNNKKSANYTSATVKNYNRINTIGNNLLNNSEITKDITFSFSTSNVINAYTDKYNVITINRGLIKYIETDDELAAVIGHEMGHVLNGDVRKSMIISYTEGLLNSSPKTAGAGTIVDMSVGKKLFRNFEYAADIAGVDMMVNAGYNPLAMISIENKIISHYNDITSTHPTAKKRMLALYNYIEKYYPSYIEEGYPTVSYQNALRIIGK